MFGAGYLLDLLRHESQEKGARKTKNEKKSQVSSLCVTSPGRRIEMKSPIDGSGSSVDVRETASTSITISQNLETTEKEGQILKISTEIISSPTTASEIISSNSDENSITSENLPTAESDNYCSVSYNFSSAPVILLSENKEFHADPHLKLRTSNNFLKGCKWSPDGSCILTNSEDRIVRTFTLPPPFYESKFDQEENTNFSLLSKHIAGETIYDYCWYPLMHSSTPDSCFYVLTSRDHPIHMCNALDGSLSCTYLPINHLDEVCCAHSLAFSLDGSHLYAGFNKTIRVFDTYRPGRQIMTKPTWRKREGGQTGIISCFAMCPTIPNLYACGSYGRSVATYTDENNGGPLAFMQTEKMGGVTHLRFHPNGNYLYSGGRMDSEILCWDMRFPGHLLASYHRDALTNQRFYFDLDRTGQYLVSGDCRGQVMVWDTSVNTSESSIAPVLSFRAHNSAVNGVSFNPFLPLMATSSGQRVFPSTLLASRKSSADDSSDSDNDEDAPKMEKMQTTGSACSENSVKLWLVGKTTMDTSTIDIKV